MTHRLAHQMALRLPDGMRDRIKSAAAVNRRSMNAEVVFHLERVFPAPQAATGDEFGDHAPAAASRTDALPGVNPTHG